MRVAVTGASGVIGSRLVHELVARDHHVMGLDNRAPKYAEDMEFLHAPLDEVDVDALPQVDAVIHLASISRTEDAFPADGARNNQACFNTAVEMASRSSSRLLIHASSIHAWGWTRPGTTLPAQWPCKTCDSVPAAEWYGAQKQIEEASLDARASQDLRSLSLRLPDTQAVSGLRRSAAKCRADVSHREHELWTYLLIEDAAEAFCRSLAWEQEGHKVLPVFAPGSKLGKRTRDVALERFPQQAVSWFERTEGWPPVRIEETEECLGWLPARMIEEEAAV